MKKFILFFILLSISKASFSQAPQEYYTLMSKTDSLYYAKDYKGAALACSNAFKSYGWKAFPGDRYNAACFWALANVPDSAFFQLQLIASKANYSDYDHISTDSDLLSLHTDKRWEPLMKKIKENKEKAYEKLNKPLALRLDSIYNDDQKCRELAMRFDNDSIGRIIMKQDSVNLVKVVAILDKYGWLGSDEVGSQGNSALFLVIQHADLKTQEKYLPMIKEAVKNGKAEPSQLALLIDRIEMRNNRPQVYGSQVTGNGF